MVGMVGAKIPCRPPPISLIIPRYVSLPNQLVKLWDELPIFFIPVDVVKDSKHFSD